MRLGWKSIDQLAICPTEKVFLPFLFLKYIFLWNKIFYFYSLHPSLMGKDTETIFLAVVWFGEHHQTLNVLYVWLYQNLWFTSATFCLFSIFFFFGGGALFFHILFSFSTILLFSFFLWGGSSPLIPSAFF